MKARVKWLVLALSLAALVVVTAPAAMAQSPVSLQVYDPSGATEIKYLNAPRVPDLNGKTICLDNSAVWESERTLDLVYELLTKQFPTAKVISYKDLPPFPTPASEIKKAGCQVVVYGNAG